MSASFEPKLVALTEYGKSLVSYSINFQEAIETGHVYMVEPVNEYGNVKVSIDAKGSIVCLVPEEDVIIQ